jgi:hypothetical protein
MVTPKQIDGDCHIKEKSRRVSHQNMVQHEDQTKVMVTVTSGKEEFEDTKGIIRIYISKKNRQHNGQKKK